MNDLKARLTSRKLWVTIGTFVVFIANKQYNEAMAVVLTYLGVAGASEVASKYKS